MDPVTLSDLDLILAWNEAATILDDAEHTLATVKGNPAITEACQKAVISSTVDIVALGKEAARRNLPLVRDKG
jgi:hypothetical protein